MKWFDRFFEARSRSLAQRTSRRSFLTRMGGGLVGAAAAVPLLPVARAQGESARRAEAPWEPEADTPQGDPASCDYWRHCAIDGFACSCCGGTQTQCPPGTELAPLTWLGTCSNPVDGKDYIISYNDCCGKTSCGSCPCYRNEGERPMYMPQKNNDTNWCQGVTSNVYHCTIAAVVGHATELG